MKVALIGATGFVGWVILKEALARGYHVGTGEMKDALEASSRESGHL
ncbi:MAG: hypothetical protein LV473_00350 [Nitrospira sp.]|nr:hypothetical protein [Nitrospira sp.]